MEEPFVCPPGVPGEKTSGSAPASGLPGKPHPATLARFVELARTAFGDRCEEEGYPVHIEGWLFAHRDDWVRDAIGCTAAMAPRLAPGMLARYTAGCLRRWHPHGPPRNEHEEATRRLATPPDGPGRGEVPAPPARKETYGERRSREIDEEVAAMKEKYAAGRGKEADRAGR